MQTTDAYQVAHPCSLMKMVSVVAVPKISRLASCCTPAGCFEFILVANYGRQFFLWSGLYSRDCLSIHCSGFMMWCGPVSDWQLAWRTVCFTSTTLTIWRVCLWALTKIPRGLVSLPRRCWRDSTDVVGTSNKHLMLEEKSRYCNFATYYLAVFCNLYKHLVIYLCEEVESTRSCVQMTKNHAT